MTDLRPAAARALRVRRLPAGPGAGRARGGRGPRHARADADRIGQVAHLPARGDAAARADARPLAADRADEGPGRQAARRDRRDRDVRQLVARPDETAGAIATSPTGRTRLLYAAPERLRNAAFVETLRAIGVGLVVIDEVHCVSMWGHDFRPDYLFIRRALEAARRAGRARHDRDRDAGHRAGDRRRTRPPARDRPHERRAAEPPLRRRAGRRQRGPAAFLVERLRRLERRAARSSTRARGTRASGSPARSAGTGSGSSTTTRASSRRSGRAFRTTSSAAASRASSPRRRSGWGSTSRTSGSSASSTTRTRSRATCRWSVAPVATASRATPCCSRARPTRPRCGGSRSSDIPGPGRPAARLPRDPRPRRRRRSRQLAAPGRPRPAGPRRHARAGRHRAPRLRPRPRDAGRAAAARGREPAGRRRPARAIRARGESASRADRAASPRATAAAISRSPSISARRSSAPCGACDVCDPRERAAPWQRGASRSPATWPTQSCARSSGLTLAARTALARRDAARLGGRAAVGPRLGVLRDARGRADAEVKRWVKALESTGALLESRPRRVPRAQARAGRAPALARAGRAAAAGRTRPSSSVCAPGGSSARARTVCRRTSCSTTPPCASSPRRGPRSLTELAG